MTGQGLSMVLRRMILCWKPSGILLLGCFCVSDTYRALVRIDDIWMHEIEVVAIIGMPSPEIAGLASNSSV